MTTPTTAERQRIDDHLRLVDRARETLGPVAWSGHLRIESGERVSDILLGRANRLAPALSLIDWRDAPIAEIFFGHGESEHYELDLGDRTVEGKLLERNLTVFDQGELVELATPQALFSRRGGKWERIERPVVHVPPRDPADAARASLDIVLDLAQQRLVDLPRKWQLLILGEAGFGKTTVALHRLAALRKKAGDDFRAAVIVPTEGLRRLTRILLQRFGADDAEVESFDRWAAAQARRAFRDVPRRESAGARSGVVQLKRHPALRDVLPEIAHRPARDDEGAPIASNAGKRARRSDLHHLFGDRVLMDQVAAKGGEAITPSAVNDIIDHTRVQFTRPSEDEYAHAAADRLTTLDGRSLDEGTPTEDAGTVDVEDYAVLFEIDRLRAAALDHKPAKLPKYDCLVVDEAQELAPIELSLLSRTLAPGGTLVVAGDAAQQVDPGASFLGWEATLRELNVPRWETATLQISYRCPPEVTEVARTLRAPHGVAKVTLGAHGPIACVRMDHELALTSWLVDELRAIRSRDGLASVCVILRTPEAAQRWTKQLRHGLDVRLALEGRFEFKPGVTVTCVPEVKGLEFDYAIVPDASSGEYPDIAEARRALYVAVTRATHRLVLATAGRWSPLLSVAAE